MRPADPTHLLTPAQNPNGLQHDLVGKHILIAEDEALLGMEIVDALHNRSAIAIGPAATLTEAMHFLNVFDTLDGAVLDIDLCGNTVFPAAEIMSNRDVPFLFYTGQSLPEEARAKFPKAPVCLKPLNVEALMDTLRHLIHTPDTL